MAYEDKRSLWVTLRWLERGPNQKVDVSPECIQYLPLQFEPLQQVVRVARQLDSRCTNGRARVVFEQHHPSVFWMKSAREEVFQPELVIHCPCLPGVIIAVLKVETMDSHNTTGRIR
jgi:hypothetical protein